jgi:hypothetical protein
MKKYVVFYCDTAEVVIASSPGEAGRLVGEKNKKAGLQLPITAIRPA